MAASGESCLMCSSRAKNRGWTVPLIIPKATRDRLLLDELGLPKVISAATITEWLERSQEGQLGARLTRDSWTFGTD